jgi:ribonucleoside-diphosphate reductase alpha chain
MAAPTAAPMAATGTDGGMIRNGAPLGATISVAATVMAGADGRSERIREARMKGYEGDACGECGNFTLVRNGTCMKCNTCGSTSGCS